MAHNVDIWKVNIESQTRWLHQHLAVLSEDERQRSLKFHQKSDHLRFVVARATLRILLGSYLCSAPDRLLFSSGEFGKPFLKTSSSLRFNTSHSGDWVMHAFSWSASVGVDAEAIDGIATEVELLGDVLAPAELVWLTGMQHEHRAAALARIWVGKEAYTKALGQGLNWPFKNICIGSADDRPYVVYDHNGANTSVECTLVRIELDAKHMGCLAYLGPAPDILIRNYLDDEFMSLAGYTKRETTRDLHHHESEVGIGTNAETRACDGICRC